MSGTTAQVQTDKAAADAAVVASSTADAAAEKPAADKTVLGAAGEKEATAKKETGDAAKGDQAKADKAQQADVEVKLPDGVEADADLIGKFKPLAKELGLKSEQAQKLVDLYVGALKSGTEKHRASQEQQLKTWTDQVKADKDIGGANLEANTKAAQAAVRKFGSPALLQFLEATGLGSHPELVRAFAKVGKAMAEDSVAGAASGGGESKSKDPWTQLYTSMQPKEQ